MLYQSTPMRTVFPIKHTSHNILFQSVPPGYFDTPTMVKVPLPATRSTNKYPGIYDAYQTESSITRSISGVTVAVCHKTLNKTSSLVSQANHSRRNGTIVSSNTNNIKKKKKKRILKRRYQESVSTSDVNFHNSPDTKRTKMTEKEMRNGKITNHISHHHHHHEPWQIKKACYILDKSLSTSQKLVLKYIGCSDLDNNNEDSSSPPSLILTPSSTQYFINNVPIQDVIQHTIDIDMIQNKVFLGFQNEKQFDLKTAIFRLVADIRFVFLNSILYFRHSTKVFKEAYLLYEFLEEELLPMLPSLVRPRSLPLPPCGSLRAIFVFLKKNIKADTDRNYYSFPDSRTIPPITKSASRQSLSHSPSPSNQLSSLSSTMICPGFVFCKRLGRRGGIPPKWYPGSWLRNARREVKLLTRKDR